MAAAADSDNAGSSKPSRNADRRSTEKSEASSRRVAFVDQPPSLQQSLGAPADVEKGRQSATSEVWAPSQDCGDSDDEERLKLLAQPAEDYSGRERTDVADTSPLDSPSARHRGTIFQQHDHAKSTALPLRILGLGLGFCTVILLWEAADHAMTNFVSPRKTLAVYLLCTSVSVVLLVMSHMWLQKLHGERRSTLIASFFYALSTLFSAFGGWGTLATSVRILVPARYRFVAFLLGGLAFLVGSIGYAMQTKHNVLLDIASCATSLGLHESDDEM